MFFFSDGLLLSKGLQLSSFGQTPMDDVGWKPVREIQQTQEKSNRPKKNQTHKGCLQPLEDGV
jgi:hypothetical protein